MAESKQYSLEIVTPTATVFSGTVQSFSVPGVIGGFQVLYNHAPLLSAIGVGEIKVIDESGQQLRYSTSGGFVEVRDNKVIMLAETAERSDLIDIERARRSRERAAARLAAKESATNEERAQAALARALNRLKIASKSSS
ncbi:MAG TPA: F0F1 ATP synthase subunit epsilon [Bacteroidota bacterium]|nr:F0F1 ATP synthase subunit epsilon [Bacteroidota bacterium]